MRCLCCNKNLTDFEATRRYKDTNKYLDMCNSCFKTIGDLVEVRERYDLLKAEDYED